MSSYQYMFAALEREKARVKELEAELSAARVQLEMLPKMKDITAPEFVEVEIREDRKVLWVNTEEGCVLRCCRIGELVVKEIHARTRRR